MIVDDRSALSQKSVHRGVRAEGIIWVGIGIDIDSHRDPESPPFGKAVNGYECCNARVERLTIIRRTDK